MITQNEAMGVATASDWERAPIASFWVRIMASCLNIKRGVLDANGTNLLEYVVAY